MPRGAKGEGNEAEPLQQKPPGVSRHGPSEDEASGGDRLDKAGRPGGPVSAVNSPTAAFTQLSR